MRYFIDDTKKDESLRIGDYLAKDIAYTIVEL